MTPGVFRYMVVPSENRISANLSPWKGILPWGNFPLNSITVLHRIDSSSKYRASFSNSGSVVWNHVRVGTRRVVEESFATREFSKASNVAHALIVLVNMESALHILVQLDRGADGWEVVLQESLEVEQNELRQSH